MNRILVAVLFLCGLLSLIDTSPVANDVSFVEENSQYWALSGSAATGPPQSWPMGPLPGAGSDCVFFCNGSFWYDMIALVLMALGSSSASSPSRAAHVFSGVSTAVSKSNANANSNANSGLGDPPTPTRTPVPLGPPLSPPYEPPQMQQKKPEPKTPTPTPTPVHTPVPCECSSIKECETGGNGMWGFGDNTFGQLGRIDRSNALEPIEIEPMKGRTVVAFSIGWEHAIAVTECGSAGNVVCRWGKHNFHRLGGKRCFQSGGEPQKLEELSQDHDKKVMIVAAGRSHTMAITENLEDSSIQLYGWGAGDLGQLGNNKDTRQGFMLPAWVLPAGPETTHFEPIDLTKFLGSHGKVVSVVSGPDHSAALFDSGALMMWGRNNYGQCGLGHLNAVHKPAQPTGVFKKVSLGYDFTIAMDGEGGLWGWGDNIRGQLGVTMMEQSFSTLPVRITFFDGVPVTTMSAASYHAFAWGEHGVYAWGDNEYGQLGIGTRLKVVAPAEIPFFRNHRNNTLGVLEMCGGRTHSVAVSVSGSVFSWGVNDSGQLGIGGTASCALTPTLVSGALAQHKFKHVACGYDNTFVW